MTKNPLFNALTALLYIVIVASVLFYGVGHIHTTNDTVFAPIGMISLFTFSAALMGYIFLSQPLQLYLDDKKKEAVNLFVRTLMIFAGLTAVMLICLFSGVSF